ncbi:MAG: ATP-dependent helicase [Chloroflexi bacterium]|nr:ATP-dependent helicase [Chloroflexota bacterium]
MSAAETALNPAESRGYEPDPERSDPGEVYLKEAAIGWENTADICVREIIPSLQTMGVPLEQIAILYRAKGPLFSELVSALTSYDIPFLAERDDKYPNSKLIRWLQDCSSWSAELAAPPQISFESLIHPFHDMAVLAGLADKGTPPLWMRSQLYQAVKGPYEPEMPFGDWIRQLGESIDLHGILDQGMSAAEDLEALQDLIDSTAANQSLAQLRLVDFANDGRVEGKVILTTLHSSKGREFDVVILPGLVEGILPSRPWNGNQRRYDEPSPTLLGQDRRLFYVGFTRARRMVFLIYSHGYINNNGYPVELGPSRLVQEIRDMLSEAKS